MYDFIRLGFEFNVNDMLRAECYATRREEGGLKLGEMCYMPMQSYDFLHLYKQFNCKMQVGGNDQWSNILGGVELVRKQMQERGGIFGMTLNLLTTSDGIKMGKTEKGAVWLDAEKTTPYELYQYFRNVDDKDVIMCLNYLTFLSVEEIKEMEAWLGSSKINEAKKILAYEITKIVHDEAEAKKAMGTAESIFTIGDSSNMDTTIIDINGNGISIVNLLQKIKLVSSASEARRLIQQGGISVNKNQIRDINTT